ncbi:stage II sporulation protein D [Deinobacterium chartae]|uniref:Stage II sporulation protein D n=1 Tax=Deinobacterium chartae TaxID=521158 RepID=A0A841I5N8_9DEIO|nr:SpoIID/LytB domain-containing protein [Deinobacterium chartae]MBB6099185.1 stage II sporulation protein D [Deinobacterium chartae]
MHRLITLLIALLGLALGGALAQPLTVRVLVAQSASLPLEIPFTHSVRYPDGRLLYQSPTPVRWALTVLPNGHIGINDQDSGSAMLYFPDPGPGTYMTVGSARYRGGMALRAENGRLQVINVVDIEDYLRSVVPAEMPPSWPLEALKAQAIIARTYAVARISPQAAYDLCATEKCQVYSGVSRENPNSDRAVADTRGQLVAWQGQAAQTYFSSDSGGYTASSAEVWGGARPYLVSKPDPASQGPHSRWTLSVPLERVAQIAAGYGARVGTLRAVTVARYSESGRPQEIRLEGSAGSARIAGGEAGGFVRSLGARSTRVTLAVEGDSLTVTGSGSGHGVGLSQYGANGLAALGWNYAQILGFYYPGAHLGNYAVADAGSAPSIVAQAELPSRALPYLTAGR